MVQKIHYCVWYQYGFYKLGFSDHYLRFLEFYILAKVIDRNKYATFKPNLFLNFASINCVV